MIALVAITASGIAIAAAGAAQTSSGEPSVSALRAQADAIANRYFEALSRSRELESEVERTKAEVADLEARAARALEAARGRALVAYQQAGSRLSVVISGDDMLDAARRARLIEHVNELDRHTYDTLRAVSKELEARRHDLEATQADQESTLESLRAQGAAVDAKLAQAAQREAEERAAALAAVAAAATPAPTSSSEPPKAATASTPTTPPTTPPTAAPTAATTPPPAVPAPPPYSGSPGTHPHHDDPFLTCVRARESGGNYGAVNPSGPYLGAYQFLQSTWNATANHAGRTELVGVPANVASPYDQDDLAWALYQWQGPAPWGGGCG